MGRHSAPDEDDGSRPDGAPDPSEVLVEVDPQQGRHAVSDSSQAAETDTAQLPHPAAATHAPSEAGRPDRSAKKRATNADLRLLRENPTLRARCTAAVVVPFVLYTVVQLVIDRVDAYLLWLWIPTVTAGVVAGLFLDRAAHAGRRPEEPTTSE